MKIKEERSDKMFVYVVERKREGDGEGGDEREMVTEKENETEKEMRFVISSVHPGTFSRAAFYCR